MSDLRDVLAEALYDVGADGPDDGTDENGRHDFSLYLADELIERLGMEQVGDGWCPVHGSASCPEQYMLRSDGSVQAGYRDHWSEDVRCGKRQPTYRLSASGRAKP